MSPSEEEVYSAIGELLDADSREAEYLILKKRQYELVSETAAGILREGIRVSQEEQNEEAGIIFKLFLRLVQDTKDKGIDEAWKAYVAHRTPGAAAFAAILTENMRENNLDELFSDGFLEAFYEAVESSEEIDTRMVLLVYLHAEGWEKAAVILKQRQDMLFSDRAISELKRLEDEASREGDELISLRIALLRRLIMQIVLEQSFEEGQKAFYRTSEDERQAIFLFLNAQTWGATRSVLQEWKEVLLTDAVVATMRQMAEVAKKEGQTEFEKSLLLHVRLLEGVRVYDIDKAWTQFAKLITPNENTS